MHHQRKTSKLQGPKHVGHGETLAPQHSFQFSAFQQKPQKSLAHNDAVVRQGDLFEMLIEGIVVEDPYRVACLQNFGHDLLVEFRVALDGDELLGHVHALHCADGR